MGASAVRDGVRGRLASALGCEFVLGREMQGGPTRRVFSAWDLARGVPATVTVVTQGEAEAAARACKAADLRHRHIARMRAPREVGGLLYCLAPGVEGESLRALLDREGLLDGETAARVLREVASALGYARRQGVAHGGVTAESIVLALGSDRAVLCDFDVTAADGDGDLYSLALVAWEMLTGQRHGADDPSLAALRPDVAPALCRAIQRALEPDPAARWPSAEAFAAAVRATERRWALDASGRLLAHLRSSRPWATRRSSRLSATRREVADRIGQLVAQAKGHWQASRLQAKGQWRALRVQAKGQWQALRLQAKAQWQTSRVWSPLTSHSARVVAGGLVVLLFVGGERASVPRAEATPVVLATLSPVALPTAPMVATVLPVTVMADDPPAPDEPADRAYHNLAAAFPETGARRELGRAQQLWRAARDRACALYTRPSKQSSCATEMSRRRATELTELLARAKRR